MKEKRDDITPDYRIRRELRMLWLKSRERSAALKRAKYCCEICGVKRSEAKGKEQPIEVHHKEGIENWDKVIKTIREEILCEPEKLICVCPRCHQKLHNKKLTYEDLIKNEGNKEQVL